MRPKPPERTFVDIRLSHLLRDCAVGAIVRHGQSLMVVRDIREWDGPNTTPYEREIRYVDLVRRSLYLGDTKLCRPPRKEQREEHVQGWVPASRFPEWTRCSRCGLLHHRPWRQRQEADETRDRAGDAPKVFRCEGPVRREDGTGAASSGEGTCGGILEQAPWVLIHDEGYLADVPWHAIAHGDAKSPGQRDCRPGWTSPHLKVESKDGRWRVRCTRRGCRAEGRLRDRFPFGANTRQQPWVRDPPPEEPAEPGWLVGVNDVRVHYAECRAAIVIPPESRIRRGSVVDRLFGSSEDRRLIGAARTERARRGRVRGIANKYGCSEADVEDALGEIGRGYPLHGRDLPSGELLELEYRALTEPIPDVRPDEDFVTEHHSAEWRRLDGEPGSLAAKVHAAVDRVVAVHRVKEIMVLDGFRRGDPERALKVPPDIEGSSDWLPALELWGEGLFFTLREAALRRWEGQDGTIARAKAFVERAVHAGLPKEVEEALSPRFLLCHTLAHLLILRLEAQAGYPAASLKERIYCCAGGDDAGDGKPMAGVLIYVAVADEHGSLGGLMDIAQPERFLKLLACAVEDASWCSYDPVCAEQEGHGPDLLNRAACHACALVPEPACLCGNRLLDRAFVNGDGEGFRSLWDMARDRRG